MNINARMQNKEVTHALLYLEEEKIIKFQLIKCFWDLTWNDDKHNLVFFVCFSDKTFKIFDSADIQKFLKEIE